MKRIVEAIPYARFLGVEVERSDGALECILPFRHEIVGNPALPAVHGGVLGAFLELTALLHLICAVTRHSRIGVRRSPADQPHAAQECGAASHCPTCRSLLVIPGDSSWVRMVSISWRARYQLSDTSALSSNTVVVRKPSRTCSSQSLVRASRSASFRKSVTDSRAARSPSGGVVSPSSPRSTRLARAPAAAIRARSRASRSGLTLSTETLSRIWMRSTRDTWGANHGSRRDSRSQPHARLRP